MPLALRCHCSGTAAVIEVLDRGTGIPAAEREQLFQPFRRLDRSRSPHTGGSGLGLAMVAEILRRHDRVQVMGPAVIDFETRSEA